MSARTGAARVATWTIAELLAWTEAHFRRLGLATPRLDAELLLAAALGLTRLQLYTGYRRPVEPAERSRFRALVERRSRREPVAYLLGEKEFFSLAFKVSPAVLIPRRESELVVEAALEALGALRSRPASEAAPRLLDLGTGSGNLAVTLAVHNPGLLADLVDLSPQALAVAGANASRHGVADRVRLLAGDLFAPVAGEERAYGVIVANPPYIAAREMAGLMDDVRLYEPEQALLDCKGGDGLGFYREIASRAQEFLAPGGEVIVEMGAGQAAAVEAIFAGAGFRVRLLEDLAGIERVAASSR
jgi:release factor glutamine methyltransferase